MQTSTLKPSIYIIDDNQTICQALQWLIKAATEYSVITYNDAWLFLNDYNASLYGCLLVDIMMPNVNGFELLQELKARGNQMPIIILTGYGDTPMVVQAMQAGASEFITKPFNSKYLLDKIQHVLNKYIEQRSQYQQYFERFAQLTPREREIMQHIISGKLNKQIAAELTIAQRTVELHRFNIMHKLQSKSLAELIHINRILNQV